MHGDEKPLKVHRDTQHFKCEVCQAVFSQKSDMEVHVSMVHEDKKPYRCGMCGVKYPEKHSLHRHMVVIHKAQSTSKCRICHALFSDVEDLKKHIILGHETTVHEEKIPITPKILKRKDENPFQCNKCGEGFKSGERLIAHVTLVHEEKKPFGSMLDDSCMSESGINESFNDENKSKIISEDEEIISGDEINSEDEIMSEHYEDSDVENVEIDPPVLKKVGLKKQMKTVHEKKKPKKKNPIESIEENVEMPYKCKFCDKRFLSTPGMFFSCFFQILRKF